MDGKKPTDGGCEAISGTRSAAFALAQIRENRPRRSELQRAKFDLCSVYLLHLHVYLALDELERVDHPVGDTLGRIEKIFRRMAGSERPGDAVAEDVRDKRTMTRDMVKNRGREKRRTEDARNPRKKNREKAEKLFERGKHAFDGNIDVHRSRSAKY